MDRELLKREIEENGIGATSRKYKIKKSKIKKVINDTSNIAVDENINNKSITSDITNSNIDIHKLKMLIENTEEILRLIEENKKNITSKINITDDTSQVTTLRVNAQLYKLVKQYSKRNNITITEIINKSFIDYLERY